MVYSVWSKVGRPHFNTAIVYSKGVACFICNFTCVLTIVSFDRKRGRVSVLKAWRKMFIFNLPGSCLGLEKVHFRCWYLHALLTQWNTRPPYWLQPFRNCSDINCLICNTFRFINAIWQVGPQRTMTLVWLEMRMRKIWLWSRWRMLRERWQWRWQWVESASSARGNLQSMRMLQWVHSIAGHMSEYTVYRVAVMVYCLWMDCSFVFL